MKTPGQIRLVVFDLGRVLVGVCDHWQRACEIAGVPVPFKTPDNHGKELLEALAREEEIGLIDSDEFCRRAAELFEVDPAHVRAMSEAYLLDTFPGAIELLDELHRAKVPTACLSNTNDHHWTLMHDRTRRCALPLDQLTYRFASHQLQLRKPDAAIYEHVERVAGASAQHILFFDDLLVNVDAARRRDWHAVQVVADCDPITQLREHLGHYEVLQRT